MASREEGRARPQQSRRFESVMDRAAMKLVDGEDSEEEEDGDEEEEEEEEVLDEEPAPGPLRKKRARA